MHIFIPNKIQSSSGSESSENEIRIKQKEAYVQALQSPHEKCEESCVFLNLFSYKQQAVRPRFNKYQICKISIHNGFDKLQKLIRKYKIPRRINRKKIQKIKISQQKENYVEQLMQTIMFLHKKNFSVRQISNMIHCDMNRITHILDNKFLYYNYQKRFTFNEEHLRWIKEFVNMDCNRQYVYSMKLIWIRFRKHFKIYTQKLKLSTFRILVKQHLPLVYRFPKKLVCKLDDDILKKDRVNYILKLVQCMEVQLKLIFLDETTINRKLKQYKLWMDPTQQASSKPQKKISNVIHVLGAIGENNFFKFQILEGNNNSQIFLNFVQELIDQALSHYKDEHFIIILDNSPIHKSNLVRKEGLGGVNYLFLPRYTPDFNPIEDVWGILKQQLGKQQYDNKQDLIRLIHKGFYDIFQYDSKKFFQSNLKRVNEYLKGVMNIK